jgi:hypothetical protein
MAQKKTKKIQARALKIHFIFHLPKYKMSQANAAARKRRAGGATLQESAPSQIQQQQQAPKSGLTLPQVISLVDKRLITLETFMNETKSGSSTLTRTTPTTAHSEDALNQMADEFNSKYEILVEEIANLKDIVMKLQSYTMEVNKTLFEERVQVLSDMTINNINIDKNEYHISDDEEGLVGDSIIEN